MTDGFINVHTFDGLLKNQFTKTDSKSRDEKIQLFTQLINDLKSPLAIEMVKIIIKDLDTGLNFQHENNTDCSDILVEILTKDYKDILSVLEEQLIDMLTLGQCPSGRVTRLLSIYLSLEI